jgi:hypothetical protein
MIRIGQEYRKTPLSVVIGVLHACGVRFTSFSRSPNTTWTMEHRMVGARQCIILRISMV